MRRLADVPPVPPHLTDAYLATAANRLQGAGDLLWEAARDELREGVANGESHRRLATRIRKATGFALPRAKVIARTEARDALLAGSLNQVRATGLTGTKRWVSVTRSARTRPEHRHAHGQEVDLAGFFEVGGWPMDRPHDESAPAELTISCRCSLSYNLDTADVLLGPAPERAPADDRLLRQVWAGGMVRAGVTVEQLAGVLADLGLTADAGSVTLPVAGSHEETPAMPWKVAKHADCDGFQVINSDTGDPVPSGCHPTKKAAEAHSRALWANAGDDAKAAADVEHFGEVDNSAWDGNAAMSGCDSAACYGSICAGRKAGPPDQRSSYALPHHKTQGGPPNAGGVRAALARFSATEGLQNAGAARRHLEAHMAAISGDSDTAVLDPTEEFAKGKPFPPKGKSEDDDCPPGQVWDPDAEECVDDGGEGMAGEDGETLGGKPNPGTPKDSRKKGRKGPEKRSKKRDKMAADPTESADDGAWQGILVVEGIPTGDGREFAPDSLVFAELPLPLTYQPPTHGGDAGPAIDVGVIDEVWRDEAESRVIRGRGRFDMKDPVAADYHRKVDEGFLRGMSVDLDDSDPITDVELTWSDAVLAKAAEHGIGEDEVPMMFPPSKKTFHKARVRGAALLSMPAFVEAQMVSAGKEPLPLPDLPVMEEAARAQEAEQDQEQKKERVAVTAAAVARLDDFRPPADWFQNPQLGQQTPITITDDMRVYGHAFRWDECHIGYGGQCVTPPEEEDFPFYTQGEVVCAAGERVAVGAITLGMGHAPTDKAVSARTAAEHYDNTAAVVADVAIGCDRVGAWVAGCIRPGTDPKRVYALRASGQVSGDWRYIGGRLRLVALLAVNVPGFPVPRPQARVAGGQVVALVAAGMLDVGPRVDWEAEIEQRALRSIRDRALAAFNDD